MLDDDVLRYRLFETRRYVAWRVWLFYFAALVTGGTLAVIATWPFCKRRKARLVSTECRADEAEFAIVEVSRDRPDRAAEG
jgi:hypothetical protein